MKDIHFYIKAKLLERQSENNFRSLKVLKGLIDFTSNDYLGFARNEKLKKLIKEENRRNCFSTGSTGSRLLSGNSEYAEQLENKIAIFHAAESALLFNSGFDANFGLLSTLPYKGSTVFYDELVHASIHDGIRASKANTIIFKHNDSDDLESKLQTTTGLKYVVVESIYSMDGDFAPLEKLTDICEKYGSGLIVDEAHATGIEGLKGEGRVFALGLQQKCLARIHTYGKTLGANGAAILCNSDLKDFLINYCRPFIFSTALPSHSLVSISCAYDFLPGVDLERAHLKRLISLLQSSVQSSPVNTLLKSDSPIQSLIVKGNEQVKLLAVSLQEKGFDVRPILYPTVAKNVERIRICLHSFNTEEEVKALANAINSTYR